MENKEIRKKDGFKDEQYISIPTESFINYSKHPLVQSLYLTDVGFFPHARYHFREREEGIEEYILLYCVEGEGRIKVGDKEYILHEQEAFCIPSNERHNYYASEENPWSIFWVHFKGDNTKHYPLGKKEIIQINSTHANNRIITLFDVLFRVLERNYTLGNYIYIAQVLGLILAEIYYREKVDEVSKQNKHVTAIVRYMYKNLERNLKLEDIEKELNLSKSYINATFKKYANRAPIDFFINLKMQEACKLLKSTDLYILEISQVLGYDDQYYFSRIFKKVIGVSPKEYRNGAYIQRQ
ncbi:helix-turn-helix domain-containing protein [Lachnospiraceae bacterium LCP25S3_G4]